MSHLAGGLIGAVTGFGINAARYVQALPDGAVLDYAGMAGFGASGALIGAIIGAVLALLIRVLRKSG